MKYLSCISLLFFIACAGSEEKNTPADKQITSSATINRLKGCWVEEADSLHIIEFTSSAMIEKYNYSIINEYPVTFFNGMPGKGGYEDASGRVIQIEESKDNFHHYSIVLLDSSYLELLHQSSGKSRFYKKQVIK